MTVERSPRQRTERRVAATATLIALLHCLATSPVAAQAPAEGGQEAAMQALGLANYYYRYKYDYYGPRAHRQESHREAQQVQW